MIRGFHPPVLRVVVANVEEHPLAERERVQDAVRPLDLPGVDRLAATAAGGGDGNGCGGSALFLATVCDAIGVGEVLSIDSEVRAGRPTHDRVTYVTGSSTAPETLEIVAEHAREKAPVMVILDSDHSRDHVLAELRSYAEFVTPGSYLVVEDTNLNGHPVLPSFGPGPMEAVHEFLGERRDFKHEAEQKKFFLTFNPDGYLRRTSPRAVPTNCRAAPHAKRAAAQPQNADPCGPLAGRGPVSQRQ